jgi:predicted dehydrogenase
MVKRITVGIVGLGNIGMMYDYHSKPGIYLSHANAFYHNKDFQIQYLIDTDQDKLAMAKQKFESANIEFLSSIDEISDYPEVMVLASIPAVNAALFEKIRNNESVRLIVIEKPFWDTSFESGDYLPYSDKCFINYFRKFIPEYQLIHQSISDQKYGRPLGAHVWYSKGLRNNGSHMIDLLFYLLGSNYDQDSLHVYQKVNDYTESDPTVGFIIRFQKEGNSFPIVFQASEERLFSLIEIDLLFEKNRLRIHDFGASIEQYHIMEDQLFPGYRNMETEKKIQIGFENCMMHMTHKISSVLNSRERNTSDLQNEYNIYNLIHLIKQKTNII